MEEQWSKEECLEVKKLRDQLYNLSAKLRKLAEEGKESWTSYSIINQAAEELDYLLEDHCINKKK